MKKKTVKIKKTAKKKTSKWSKNRSLSKFYEKEDLDRALKVLDEIYFDIANDRIRALNERAMLYYRARGEKDMEENCRVKAGASVPVKIGAKMKRRLL